jgi:predicted dinucleotide-utilizing enzyme
MKSLVISISLLVTLSACSWVKPTTRSQAIAYVAPAQIGGCQKVGSVAVETVGKVALMQRDPVTVKNELITLAKNEAVILKGDTIADLTSVKDGKQEFGVYRCR